MEDTKKILQEHVQHIAESISNGFEGKLNNDGEPLTAYDWLENVLDIEWICNSDKTFKSAVVLVAFGGPNIYVNFQRRHVEGYWGSDEAFANFYDEPAIEEVLEEIFNN